MKTNIVSAKWLLDHIKNPNLVIIDCRFWLGQAEKGYEEYQKNHIPGAYFLDLEKDLSAPVRKHGGRHPLPSIEVFVQTLSKVGIDSSKQIIMYDDQGGAMASRLWWMLKYVGHTNAAILEEGFSNWKKKGYPTTTEIPQATYTTFVADIQENMIATMEEVKEKLGNDRVLLLDSRSEERYLGVKEEVDPVAGHIPGAILENWQNRLTEDGVWKSKEEQSKSLKRFVNTDKEIIVYCGSGVTACANILALDEIGLQPRLYAGSWSDWITYENNPVKIGEENE
jgi:thiosulfate/3-mercaptopyruvate sulfurtransferase